MFDVQFFVFGLINFAKIAKFAKISIYYTHENNTPKVNGIKLEIFIDYIHIKSRSARRKSTIVFKLHHTEDLFDILISITKTSSSVHC